MAIERYTNDYESTLNGTINSAVTSLVVAAAPVDASTGNFRIKIDDEILKVTGVSGTTLTVVRAVDGTVAAGHTNGADVFGVLTRESLGAIRSEGITSGALASVVAAADAGRLYFPSDAPFACLADGSVVQQFGPIWKLTPPVDSDFSWVNQGGASVSTANGGIILTAPIDAGSPQLRLRTKAQPSTPYTVTVMMTADIFPADPDQLAGIGFRESGTGKLETMHFVYSSGSGGLLLACSKWASATSYVSDRIVKVFASLLSPKWFRLKHDGTTLYFQYSQNGFTWQTLVSFAKANYFGSGPDQVFFFANGSATAWAVYAHLLSWKDN